MQMCLPPTPSPPHTAHSIHIYSHMCQAIYKGEGAKVAIVDLCDDALELHRKGLHLKLEDRAAKYQASAEEEKNAKDDDQQAPSPFPIQQTSPQVI